MKNSVQIYTLHNLHPYASIISKQIKSLKTKKKTNGIQFHGDLSVVNIQESTYFLFSFL